MKRIEHNPVFESILSSVKKYGSEPINEEATDKLDPESASKYVRMIIGEWASNIVNFSLGAPDDLKEKIYPPTMEAMQKLGNNASIDDLVGSLKTIWKDLMTKVNAYDKKDVVEAYQGANNGFAKLEEAYKIYKEKAGDLASNQEILKSVNDGMAEYVKNAQESIKLAVNTTK